MASYAEIVEGLHERFATVPGLKPELILDYEPKVIVEAPLLYTMLSEFKESTQGGMTARRYKLMHRLFIKWQDNERAEQQLIGFVDAIPRSVDQDPQLGGRLPDGLAIISEGKSGFAKVGGNEGRVIDYFSDVVDNVPYGE